MTIGEATQLVLEAGAMSIGCEGYIFDMGDPVKILDLAKKMIIQSGLKPYVDIEIEYIDREELATINTPNPSKTEQSIEGTPSDSEAAAIKSSEGKLIVEKQKFPPNLTIAIARINN